MAQILLDCALEYTIAEASAVVWKYPSLLKMIKNVEDYITVKPPCLGLSEANLAQILLNCTLEYLSHIHLCRAAVLL